MDLDKLAKKLYGEVWDCFDWRYLPAEDKERWNYLARRVALMMLGARRDELTVQVHGLGYYDSRIAEIEVEIQKIKEG